MSIYQILLETEGWKPPCCLFPHNQVQEYTDFVERHSASVNFGWCSHKQESISWVGVPRKASQGPAALSHHPLKEVSEEPQLLTPDGPSEGVPGPCDTRRKAIPKFPRQLESYHQNEMTKELINLCHIGRLWNAMGTYFRISPFQKKQMVHCYFLHPNLVT